MKMTIIIILIPTIRVSINNLKKSNRSKKNFFSGKRVELKITDISNFVSDDWINLAHELGFQSTDIAQIQKEYPDSVGQQCMSMLNLWMNEISGQDSGICYIFYYFICIQ